MRSVLALGLLITLCASANTATVHHLRTRHHVIVRQGMTDPRALPSRVGRTKEVLNDFPD
jgi:hypothetical protein